MFHREIYDSLNFRTAFTVEVDGLYRAEGFYDGTAVVYLSVDDRIVEFKLCEHGAPITDLAFVVTDNSGISPTENCIILVTASYDKRIICWHLKYGKWKPLKIHNLKNEYCTSISSDERGEKILFSFSNGKICCINANEIKEDFSNVEGISVSDGPVYSCFDKFHSDKIVVGNRKGELLTYQDGKLVQKSKVSDSPIRYIDMSSKIIITCEDYTILVLNSFENYKIENAETGIKEESFVPIMSKVDPLTEALYVLSDSGKVVELLKFPNGNYREM